MLSLFLAHLAERRHTLQVADDTGQVIQVVASALRTYGQCILADVAAVVADSIAAVECEIIRAVMRSDIEQLPVLVLAQMLGNVHVQRRTAIQIFDIVLSVEFELVDH